MAKKKAKKKVVKKKLARKKAAKKRSAKKQPKAKTKKTKALKPIGEVTHFFSEISVAIVKFKQNVPVGAVLYYKGATTDFKDAAKSIQYDHKPITFAKKGKEVGIKVKKRVRPGDQVHFAE